MESWCGHRLEEFFEEKEGRNDEMELSTVVCQWCTNRADMARANRDVDENNMDDVYLRWVKSKSRPRDDWCRVWDNVRYERRGGRWTLQRGSAGQ